MTNDNKTIVIKYLDGPEDDRILRSDSADETEASAARALYARYPDDSSIGIKFPMLSTSQVDHIRKLAENDKPGEFVSNPNPTLHNHTYGILDHKESDDEIVITLKHLGASRM